MSARERGDATPFAFSDENRAVADKIIARYPEGRQASAVIPLLDLAQRQSGGWLPQGAMDAVAELLAMPTIRVYEVASFYTMFRLRKPGKHVVEVCTTTPCWLRGSDAVLKTCRETLGIDVGETDAAGDFTLMEVECLGACVNAPMMQIGDDYYEDLDAESTRRVLEALRKGETPTAGSQIGRKSSEPVTGSTTLLAKSESA
ncbi:MAG: NADH-quinone oxidoreductase subunit NuoE [Rhodospirillaceae bacterium]|nr:NADH-quinone oxidoreductase subunit NuoE [Rhodospirillaceae bacterium]